MAKREEEDVQSSTSTTTTKSNLRSNNAEYLGRCTVVDNTIPARCLLLKSTANGTVFLHEGRDLSVSDWE